MGLDHGGFILSFFFFPLHWLWSLSRNRPNTSNQPRLSICSLTDALVTQPQGQSKISIKGWEDSYGLDVRWSLQRIHHSLQWPMSVLPPPIPLVHFSRFTSPLRREKSAFLAALCRRNTSCSQQKAECCKHRSWQQSDSRTDRQLKNSALGLFVTP